MMASAFGIDGEEGLSIKTVTALSGAIAAQYDPRLRVVGVASSDAENGRVELLVTIRACDREPCMVMLNVTRRGEDAFAQDLREKFHDALISHVTST
jgi:hypothetical protein